MNWLAREIQKAPRWLKMLAIMVWTALLLLLLLAWLAPGMRQRAGALSGVFAPNATAQVPDANAELQPDTGESTQPPLVRTIVVVPGHEDPTPDPAAATPVPTHQSEFGAIIDSIFGGGSESTAATVAETPASTGETPVPVPQPTTVVITEVPATGGIIRFNPELMAPGVLREGETGGCLTGIVLLTNPVESVKVSVALGADDRWTEVNRETGEYRICGLPDGTWRTLVVEVPGREMDFSAGVDVQITSGVATTVNWYEATGF
jgi:hypothetical protein